MVLAGDVWLMAGGGDIDPESFPRVWWSVVSGRGLSLFLWFCGCIQLEAETPAESRPPFKFPSERLAGA